MFEATEKAVVTLSGYMKERNLTSSIRITLSGG